MEGGALVRGSLDQSRNIYGKLMEEDGYSVNLQGQHHSVVCTFHILEVKLKCQRVFF